MRRVLWVLVVLVLGGAGVGVGLALTRGGEGDGVAAPAPSLLVTPSATAHQVGGAQGADWSAEVSGYPWVGEVVSVDWVEGSPWLRVVVADGVDAQTAVDICRTAVPFFGRHTGGVGRAVWVSDSRGRLAESGSDGRCRRST